MFALFALFLLFSASREDPIYFETTLFCSKDHIGPNGWCAEAFYDDHDHWTTDDAVHYFLKCSKNETIHVESDGAFPGGDEMASHYALNFVIFHNCYANYYDHLLEDGNVNLCLCEISKDHHFIAKYSIQHMQTKLNFSEVTPVLDDKGCQVPLGFGEAKLQSGEEFPKRGCNWKGFQQQEIKWSI